MENEFSEEKSVADNVKVSIDKILKSKTTLKKKPKTAEDKKKELFADFIDKLEEATYRSETMFTLFGINNELYDNTFIDAIDSLALLMFSEAQMSLIEWYINDRHTPEGDLLSLETAAGGLITLEHPDHLWEYLKTVK